MPLLLAPAALVLFSSSGAAAPTVPEQFTSLSAWAIHSCGVKTDGTLACWGAQRRPAGVAAQRHVRRRQRRKCGELRRASAGGNHSCGIRPNGTPVCWGSNVYRQSSPPIYSAGTGAGLTRIACSARPKILWPASGKLVTVTVRVKVTGSAVFRLLSVTSNQAGSAKDVRGWKIGTGDTRGKLRAERHHAPRRYTITYRAGTATCKMVVTVPLRRP